MTRHDQPPTTPPATEAKPTPRPRVLDSSDLLRGEKTVEIVHGADRYRLIVTRNGKLILQK